MNLDEIYKKEEIIVGEGKIILITAKTQYHLTSLFVRMQEFYESPYKNINGKYFMLSEFMDTYAENRNGEFTYFTDWNGFNIPGNVIGDFYVNFPNWDMSEKEHWLLNNIPFDERFYVIGIHEQKSTVVEHEIAHALYYLNPEYKKECDRIMKFSRLDKFAEEPLRKLGYGDNVLLDETQAYMATSYYEELLELFGIDSSDYEWNGWYGIRQLIFNFAKYSVDIPKHLLSESQ